MLQILERYGLPILLLIILYLILRPKAEQLWSLLMKTIDPAPVSVEAITKLDMDMNVLLTEVVLTMKANSATVWQFHNGQKSLSGVSFLKITATHQRVAPGKDVWATTYQNLPVSLFLACDKFIDVISTYAPLTLSIEERLGNETMIGIMQEQNEKLVSIQAIRNKSDCVIALLAVGFSGHPELDEKDMKTLDRFADRAMIIIATQAELAKKEKHNG
jgi:hypothetical protein